MPVLYCSTRTAAPSPSNDLASDTLVDFHTGARHAAHPLHALDAGRALVHDDIHVRRGAGLSFFRLDGAGARARRVEGREETSTTQKRRYDETRKYMMRATSPEVVDAVTGAVQRQAGWIEKSTYY